MLRSKVKQPQSLQIKQFSRFRQQSVPSKMKNPPKTKFQGYFQQNMLPVEKNGKKKPQPNIDLAKISDTSMNFKGF